MSVERSTKLLRTLYEQGVRDLVLCPGSYNSPLIFAAEKLGFFSLQYHFDERAAAFYALGRIKLQGLPVVVCTTSGTAVAECLSAVIEARYTGLPLVIVSADRPSRYVGTGAPQVIEQSGLLSAFAASCYDLSGDECNCTIAPSSPTHINIRFEEPLFGELKFGSVAVPQEAIGDFSSFKRPLIIVSELSNAQRAELIPMLETLNAPLFAEPLSGLKEIVSLQKNILLASEWSSKKIDVDVVVRIGGVPVSSLWRDLERNPSWQKVPVYCFSDLPYSGLSRQKEVYPFSRLSSMLSSLNVDERFLSVVKRIDAEFAQQISSLLLEYPCAEQSLVRSLSRLIQDDALVYLGNSLPIREWADFANVTAQQVSYHANRGVNGIDGQIATFVGAIADQSTSWAIVGDLTFLYDVSSLSLLKKVKSPYRLVVINNRGGQIFTKLSYFSSKFEGERAQHFINAQRVDIQALCRGFGIDCISTSEIGGQEFPAQCVVELLPDLSQTCLVTECLNALVK